MALHLADVAIILGYLTLTVVIGFWVSKRASAGLKSYFLGGNRLPWYALGLSNASGMFDVAGTMWMVSLLFVYGLKSIFIPWLWPVFNQIFLMVFLAMWLRRSGVMTGAEWIRLRFGDGRGAQIAHILIVTFALLTVLGYMAFGFLGIGKLAAGFLPFTLASDPGLNEKLYALIIVGVTTLYVVKGGMYSVVFTEVMQFAVMTIACIGIGIVAIGATTPEQIAAATPEGWSQLSLDWRLALDWSERIPAVDAQIASDGYELFAIFVLLALFKGVFQSAAGPAPNYDMQRVLSARSPREAAMMSGFVSLVLLFPRYLMIAGLTVLALVYFSGQLNAMGETADFEAILPFALTHFLPAGLLGLVLAGLLAAFMSSFAAALNAAPAYLVNDIYKRYARADAPERHYLNLSYAVCASFVIIGTSVGLFLQSIDDIVFWITSGLFGGYTAANVLKWYWWRINGYGYAAGMVAGIFFALVLGLPGDANPLLFSLQALYQGLGLTVARVDALNAFPVLFAICISVTILAALLTPADPMETLKTFYLKTRPWGFWGPVHRALETGGTPVSRNTDFARDMINIAIGITWQTALMAAPVFLVIRDWTGFAISAGVIVATMTLLKFTWYDRLEQAGGNADRLG